MRIIHLAIVGIVLGATFTPVHAATGAADFEVLSNGGYESGRLSSDQEIGRGPGIGCDRNPPPSQC